MKTEKPTTAPKPILAIHLAVAAVMQDIKAIERSQENKAQGFWFRGIDDVMSALHPIFAAHGVICVPEIIEAEHGDIGKNSKGNTVYCAKVRVRYSLFGPGGDHITGSSFGVAFDSGDKATPKAMTMAYKTWLTQTFVIGTYDMQDADAYDPTVSPRELPPGKPVDAVDPVAAEEAMKTPPPEPKAEPAPAPATAKAEPAPKKPTKAEKAAPKSETAPEAPPEEQNAPQAPETQASDTWEDYIISQISVERYKGKRLGDLAPEDFLFIRKNWIDKNLEKFKTAPAKAHEAAMINKGLAHHIAQEAAQ